MHPRQPILYRQDRFILTAPTVGGEERENSLLNFILEKVFATPAIMANNCPFLDPPTLEADPDPCPSAPHSVRHCVCPSV